jgi:Epoxide hydrolase N terminus
MRTAATRWPTRELVDDRSQGVQLATIQELARYWMTDHDWRACEARLNALPQFTTEIDGQDIHFIHVRSPHADAMGRQAPAGLLGIHLNFLRALTR